MNWFFAYGGPILPILVLFSILATTIGIYKFFQLRGAVLKARSCFEKVLGLLRKKRVKEAIQHCRSVEHAFGRICHFGLKNIEETRDRIRGVLEDKAQVELGGFKKGLGVLSTIAHVSPLLGLLGTVLGMISAFQNVQKTTGQGGGVDPQILSGGIWQALITTAAGLSVAIFVYLFYRYLESLRESLFETVEHKSIELMNVLSQFRRKPSGRKKNDDTKEKSKVGRKQKMRSKQG